MAGPGLLSLFFQDLRWVLSSVDDGFKVEGQFTTTDLVEDISANYSEFRSVGRSQPILQFNDNANDKMTFTARFWAQHEGLFGVFADKVDAQIEAVRSLPRVEPSLGRPRIFDFAVGDAISLRCVVDSVGGIAYDRLRPLKGDLRGFTAKIVLRRFDEYDVTLSGRAAESLVQPFLFGDSFESLARRYYSAPSLGEALRRRNPTVTPAVGTFVHLPPAAKLAQGFALEPTSPALARTEANASRRRKLFRARKSRAAYAYTLGREWHRAGASQ